MFLTLTQNADAKKEKSFKTENIYLRNSWM